MLKWILRHTVYRASIASMRNLLAIQGADGSWDYDPYMTGLYNGLELACATLENREAKFRTYPGERPVIRIDDGTDVFLSSYAGGGNALGFLGEISLRVVQGDKQSIISYRKVEEREHEQNTEQCGKSDRAAGVSCKENAGTE